MKRSRTASLVVMGLSPLFISACDDTHKSQQEFVSIDACTQAGVPSFSCEEAYDRASAEAVQFASHFNSEVLCDENYDPSTCVETQDTNGNHFWFPAMSAFLIARVMHGQQVSYFPAGPVYRKPDHSDYSPRYGSVYAGGGSGGWRAVSSEEAAGEGDTVSRGGFGGSDEGGHS
jgi:uncharacterized protein YgiB involved in biofilm formation